jgi:hypothetical protein
MPTIINLSNGDKVDAIEDPTEVESKFATAGGNNNVVKVTSAYGAGVEIYIAAAQIVSWQPAPEGSVNF